MKVKQFIISSGTTIVKIIVAVILVTNLYKWTTTAYEFGYRVFAEPPISSAPGTKYSVTIAEGAGPKEVAETLKEYGLIRDTKIFYVQYLLSECKGKLRPGTYELCSAQTAEEMLAVLAGNAVAEETESVTRAEETESFESVTEEAESLATQAEEE